jgi:hypothetical protein
MTDTFVSWMIWWFALFGVNDWNYVRLGITLIATAALMTVLWLVILIAIGVVAAIAEAMKGRA